MRVFGGNARDGQRRLGCVKYRTRSFHERDWPAVSSEKRIERAFQIPQPLPQSSPVRFRAWGIPGIQPVFNGRRRPDPSLQPRALHQPYKTQQVAPRTSAPVQIQGVAVELMPIPWNRERNRVDSQVLQPYQFAFPKLWRICLIRKLDGLHELVRRLGRGRSACQQQEQDESTHQNAVDLRRR